MCFPLSDFSWNNPSVHSKENRNRIGVEFFLKSLILVFIKIVIALWLKIRAHLDIRGSNLRFSLALQLEKKSVSSNFQLFEKVFFSMNLKNFFSQSLRKTKSSF